MSGTEPTSNDLAELIALFNKHGVEYLVVGAHAVAFHGYVRQTMDLDLWVRQRLDNLKRVVAALREFGYPIPATALEEFQQHEQMLVLGVEPNRVDILTWLTGCDFDEAWSRRASGQLLLVDAHFLALEDLIRSKEAVRRPKDRNDLLYLRKLKRARQKE